MTMILLESSLMMSPTWIFTKSFTGFPHVVPQCIVSPNRIRTLAFHGVPYAAGGMPIWTRYSHALAQRIFPSFWKNSVFAGRLV